MATVKLSKNLRDKIRKRLLDKKFDPLLKKLKDEELAFYTRLHRELYTEADWKKMQALPKGWLPNAGHISFKFGSRYERYTAPGSAPSFLVRDEQRGNVLAVFDAKDPATEEYLNISDRLEKLIGERRTRGNEIDAITGSVTTLARLWEVWPEVQSATQDLDITPKKTMLPATQLDNLNKNLGLPV